MEQLATPLWTKNSPAITNSPLIPLEIPIPSKSYTGAKLQIYQHGEDAFFVIKLGRYPLILGIQWLQHHDVTF